MSSDVTRCQFNHDLLHGEGPRSVRFSQPKSVRHAATGMTPIQFPFLNVKYIRSDLVFHFITVISLWLIEEQINFICAIMMHQAGVFHLARFRLRINAIELGCIGFGL